VFNSLRFAESKARYLVDQARRGALLCICLLDQGHGLQANDRDEDLGEMMLIGIGAYSLGVPRAWPGKSKGRHSTVFAFRRLATLVGGIAHASSSWIITVGTDAVLMHPCNYDRHNQAILCF
jgi:hypothetical protein